MSLIISDEYALFAVDGSYVVYDDFESYPIAAFAGNDKWVVDTTGGGTVEIASTDGVTGTTSQALRISSSGIGNTANVITNSVDFIPSRKYYGLIYFDLHSMKSPTPPNDRQVYVYFIVDSVEYLIAHLYLGYVASGSYSQAYLKTTSSFLITQTPAGLWTVFVGGKLLVTKSSISSFGFKMSGGQANNYLYVDDVRWS
jgi:hypothetical protein